MIIGCSIRVASRLAPIRISSWRSKPPPSGPSWMLIPDLEETWDAIKMAFVAGQFKDAGNLLLQFERQCRVSADLIPADAGRLTNKARSTFSRQDPQPARSFGMRPIGSAVGGAAAPAFPAFAELGLYD